ncbi:uncharacterized protein LOC112057355 isoform X2 [Bicyclus anynana]|nr:uncharacterized protein LOC112057355 isoform X2 [Bicyclus anynana]
MEGWSYAERPPGPLQQLKMYCSPGWYICPLYAPDFIAGLQIALPADDLYTAAIDPNKWFTKWKTPANGSDPGKVYWTITQYYVSEETLEAGCGPQAINGSTLQGDGVWVHDHSGQLMLIPRTEAEIKSKTPFTKQNCIPRMGTHYRYNMTREMPCETQLPWFALTIDGQLIGSGLQFFGDLTKPTEYRNWFERIRSTRTSARAVVPIGPECYYDYADKHRTFSLHIYFMDDPEKIKCRLEDSADPSTLLEFN